MRKLSVLLISLIITASAFAQNNTGIGTTTPNSNALLELDNNSNPLGLLLPRQDISTFVGLGASENGLMVFNTADNKVYTWNGSVWVSGTSEWGVNGNDIFSLNSGNVGIGTNAPGEKLTVVDNVFGGIVSLNSSSFNTLMDFNNTSTNPANWTFGYLGNTGVNPGFMTFLRGSHRFVVTNNGDVGIAETNPQARLEVNSSGNSGASYAMLINNSNPTNIFAIQDDGNVGIGTINPDETLTVGDPLGVGYVFPAISVGGATSGGGLVIGSPTNYFNIDHSNTFSRGRIISTDVGGYGQGDIEFRVGGIGINTPTPQNDLDVEGAVAIGAGYSGSSVAPTNGLIVEGQVGIGTNTISSSNKFELNTLTNPYSATFNNNYTGVLPQYGIYNRVNQASAGAFAYYGFLSTSGTNAFYGLRLFYAGTGTGTRYGLTIQGDDVNYISGNLGVGSAVTPTQTLQVSGTGSFTGRVELTATTDANPSVGSGVLEIGGNLRIDGNEIITNTLNPIYFQQGNDGDFVVNFSALHVDGQSDNVGVNTSSPQGQLHIKQAAGLDGLVIENDGDTDTWEWNIGANDLNFYFNNTYKGYWDDADGSYTPASDRRLKKNIQDLDYGLEDVLKLRPKRYDFIDNETDNSKSFGLIAQEAELVIPELVSSPSVEEEREFYSMNYSGLIPVLVKAIQELEEKNELLLKKIEALESK